MARFEQWSGSIARRWGAAFLSQYGTWSRCYRFWFARCCRSLIKATDCVTYRPTLFGHRTTFEALGDPS
jgi:hypothetical protein